MSDIRDWSGWVGAGLISCVALLLSLLRWWLVAICLDSFQLLWLLPLWSRYRMSLCWSYFGLVLVFCCVWLSRHYPFSSSLLSRGLIIWSYAWRKSSSNDITLISVDIFKCYGPKLIPWQSSRTKKNIFSKFSSKSIFQKMCNFILFVDNMHRSILDLWWCILDQWLNI